MIAILSDFGDSEYLGIMKAVILSSSRNSKIIDLANNISPQSVKEGAWILMNSYRYFPKKTVFLCVVDPGVGTARLPIIIESNRYYFVGPDNGLMYPAADKDGIKRIYRINAETSSGTFHGRDVFAPAAARLDSKNLPESLGKEIRGLTTLEFFLDGREGEIVKIDRYGNIITNIPPAGKRSYLVKLGRPGKNQEEFCKEIPFYKNYESAREEEIFVVEGSSKTLEISMNMMPAASLLEAIPGMKIIIE